MFDDHQTKIVQLEANLQATGDQIAKLEKEAVVVAVRRQNDKDNTLVVGCNWMRRRPRWSSAKVVKLEA